MQHRCLQLQTNAFVIPCYINAWNCGAKCAELSCLSPVYVARGERKQDGHERPLSRTGLPDFLEFLKLLASGDGTCCFNPQNERSWREEREARERENAWIWYWALCQTCFRPLRKDHLIFAKSCQHQYSSSAACGPWR